MQQPEANDIPQDFVELWQQAVNTNAKVRLSLVCHRSGLGSQERPLREMADLGKEFLHATA